MMKHQLLWWYSFFMEVLFFSKWNMEFHFERKTNFIPSALLLMKMFPSHSVSNMMMKTDKDLYNPLYECIFWFLVFMVIITWWQDDIIHSKWKQYPFKNNDNNVDDDSTMTMMMSTTTISSFFLLPILNKCRYRLCHDCFLFRF